MLRPATPMSVLLFAAFALLLLSTLSTPIIKPIPLGSFKGANFGVFGVCRANGKCEGPEIGYDTTKVFAAADHRGAFDLPDSARNTLSAILIVHPIAALTTLIMFIMGAVAHLHSPSHSARYLLAVFIFSFIDFLICLLAFLVDVLLFVPHMAWGSYIVLAATILVGMSALVACAMRRMLVSRKARKKRIAENAEMSGENYYNREAQSKPAVPASPQPTMPVVSGGNGMDKMPTYASFESQKDDQVSDERIPLTSRSPVNGFQGAAAAMDAPPSRSGSVPPHQRDPYGNPMPPQDGFGPRRGPSQERMRGRGGPPPGGFRGRGGGGGYGRGGYNNYGPPPPGRGGYGPPGRGGYGGPPPGGRGGYGPPPRGGFGPNGMRGGRPPPPGYQPGPGGPGPYDRGPSPGNGYGGPPPGGPGPYDRRPSPGNGYGGPPPGGPYAARRSMDMAPGYISANNSTNPSLPSIPQQQGYETYNPERTSLPRAESPPPLPGDVPPLMAGQAVEMNAVTGSPSHAPTGFGQFRDSDADIAGMVGLQQQNGGNRAPPRRHDTYMTEGSRYSTDEAYLPPRQAWNQNGNASRMASPLQRGELPARSSPAPAGSDYYEDVDPRFADAPSSAPASRAGAPPALQVPLPAPNMYDDAHADAGARSPGAESDLSNFTSISQRGINPRWNPAPPIPGFHQQMPPRRPVQQRRQDMLLNNNPDFELPGSRLGPPSRMGGNGMIPGSAYPPGF
ncbi:pH-response regulator [Colletotrichum graminicola]|uniref:pH-response regulator n=1 Tax=Colletotrichum graminicola (strain M1.001 / M2 / FGSC 10212) TaxID=645133 RepID=E3Q748_COLGM|nr:pH-response regulator [Colletotrichum graminicola M1.001]EFQ26686.1 pH-response regulator [Colletotrichum graminicola M1.001]WDK17804.1 pH-response regulator [Colletotrichum graminicola]